MRGTEFGVELESAVTSMKGVQARKKAMVDSLIQLQLDCYRTIRAELIMGEARFVGDGRSMSSWLAAVSVGSAASGCS